jgi:3',5'-cyclic AMP phosphodiesterase CpdA
MRVLVTADLHYNHAHSKPLADEVIAEMNSAGGDVLVVVGDTAVADGDSLEACLNLFHFSGPKLFVAGNHELWTKGSDSYTIFSEQLPRRVRALGWHWLETEPFIAGHVGFVGSIGWYDYSFAAKRLGIPNRFYAAKLSPGAAKRDSTLAHLFDPLDDISLDAMQTIARWNDGKFVKLGRSDEDFLQEILSRLSAQLKLVENLATIVACVHHVPFRELLPPPHSAQWDFAKAFLGSEKLGELLLTQHNVEHVFCGHSHLPMESNIQHVKAINIGSGYRWKTFHTLELP